MKYEEIFSSPRALEEARNFSKSQEYEGIWRSTTEYEKYEGTMKKIW